MLRPVVPARTHLAASLRFCIAAFQTFVSAIVHSSVQHPCSAPLLCVRLYHADSAASHALWICSADVGVQRAPIGEVQHLGELVETRKTRTLSSACQAERMTCRNSDSNSVCGLSPIYSRCPCSLWLSIVNSNLLQHGHR